MKSISFCSLLFLLFLGPRNDCLSQTRQHFYCYFADDIGKRVWVSDMMSWDKPKNVTSDLVPTYQHGFEKFPEKVGFVKIQSTGERGRFQTLGQLQEGRQKLIDWYSGNSKDYEVIDIGVWFPTKTPYTFHGGASQE